MTSRGGRSATPGDQEVAPAPTRGNAGDHLRKEFLVEVFGPPPASFLCVALLGGTDLVALAGAVGQR